MLLRSVFATLLFFTFSLFGADYDCVFIGSSPISLFEALYQHGLGKRVLIVDESPICGGAWKSIEICGVEHVDVGCHEIGSNKTLKKFLEIYGGCQMVSTEKNDCFYFSNGCYELIHNLEERIAKTTIDLLLNTRADRAIFDDKNKYVVIQMGNRSVSTDKIYMSAYSFLNIGTEPDRKVHKSNYFHLYLLIADPTAPRFSYRADSVSNTSRMMNLTRFAGLQNTGRQLIVFQTNESNLEDGEIFLTELKNRKLVDMGAYILKSEPYIYAQWPSSPCKARENYPSYFETLQTYDFRSMVNSLSRWTEVLQPYAEIVKQPLY